MKPIFHTATVLLNWSIFGILLVSIPVLITNQWEEKQSSGLLSWLASNLGYSVVAFILVIVCFIASLTRLNKALCQAKPIEENVQHLDNLSDIMTSLSFGVGVIWTAIGMRNALVSGLGSIDMEKTGGNSAFLILEHLVNGGILVALSTTIVGGILGYLMRLSKSVLVSKRLNLFYRQQDDYLMQCLMQDVRAIKMCLPKANIDHKGEKHE